MKRIFNELSTKLKVIAAIVSSLVIMWSISYSVVTFVDHGNQCYYELKSLRKDFDEYKKVATTKHNELERKVENSENDFKLTAAKLDTSLARIATDLQFIKEQLMSRGLK